MQNLELMKIKPLLCGELVFEMGAVPSKKWEVGKDAVPPLMSK